MIGDHAAKPDPGRLIEPKLDKIGSLAELDREGFTVFALGPVYVYGGVQDDLVAAFAAEREPERPQDVMATLIRFDRPVIAACREWSFILNVMDLHSFAWFKKWMLALQLIDRRRDAFWLIRHYLAPMLDPILLDSDKGRKAEFVDVFCPSGMRGRIVPVTGLSRFEDAPEYIKFTVEQSEPEVVRLGRAALEVLHGT